MRGWRSWPSLGKWSLEGRHSRKSAVAVTASRAPNKSAPRPRDVRPPQGPKPRPFPSDVLKMKSTVGP